MCMYVLVCVAAREAAHEIMLLTTQKQAKTPPSFLTFVPAFSSLQSSSAFFKASCGQGNGFALLLTVFVHVASGFMKIQQRQRHAMPCLIYCDISHHDVLLQELLIFVRLLRPQLDVSAAHVHLSAHINTRSKPNGIALQPWGRGRLYEIGSCTIHADFSRYNLLYLM